MALYNLSKLPNSMSSTLQAGGSGTSSAYKRFPGRGLEATANTKS